MTRDREAFRFQWSACTRKKSEKGEKRKEKKGQKRGGGGRAAGARGGQPLVVLSTSTREPVARGELPGSVQRIHRSLDGDRRVGPIPGATIPLDPQSDMDPRRSSLKMYQLVKHCIRVEGRNWPLTRPLSARPARLELPLPASA